MTDNKKWINARNSFRAAADNRAFASAATRFLLIDEKLDCVSKSGTKHAPYQDFKYSA